MSVEQIQALLIAITIATLLGVEFATPTEGLCQSCVRRVRRNNQLMAWLLGPLAYFAFAKVMITGLRSHSPTIDEYVAVGIFSALFFGALFAIGRAVARRFPHWIWVRG